jgi:hypothetical protein
MKSLFTTHRFCIVLAFSLYLSVVPNLHAQLNFKWAVNQGSNDTELTGSCKLDDQGGLYTTVAFRDTADLDPGPGEHMVFVGEDEVFVLNKFTQDGAYLWSSQFRTKGDAGGQIAEIRDNRILLIVYYTDSLIYSHHTPWMAVNPGPNMAAISMNLEGQIISYRHIANTNDMYFSDFITQPDGTILAGGGFGNSVTFNTPDSTMTLTSAGKDDAFIVRFNDQLQLEWIRLFASTGYDFTESVYIGEEDKIFYAVIHDSTVVLQTNHGEVISAANGEDNSIFGWTLPDGSIETAYLFGGDLGDQIRNIVADTDGNMYINGYYTGEVNFQHPSGQPVIYTDLEEGEGFIAKYSPDGFLDWARIFTNGEYGGIYTMKMHRNTHLYFSGAYNLVSDLDPGPDSLIYDGGYDGDLMFGKMSTEGDLAWVYSIVGSSDEGIRNFFPGTDDKVFVHGYYYGDLDCDPGPDSVGILTQGGADVFLIGFTEENVITSVDQPDVFDIIVYPNPFSDRFVIQAEAPIEHVAIYDLDGKFLSVPLSYENTSVAVNASTLDAGLYVAHVKTSNGFSAIKLLKQ